ncbi:HK97 gp10 family phage protein [Lachnoanaerobaculum orale]|uniref:HK97 gp10 family phage protein n=1 Tax=Lachnoanaerobaculum orale TaxID=979627 RepID=A0A3P3Q515_9FIRM|nr:HK97 gp10 family phage protein [Lachnoanaerobaculum orale]RRJ15503.1 HK97 gp10 family phage protein [Lachnoanaerobaculum orale]
MAESVNFIGLEGLMSDMQGLISKAPDELNKAVEKTAREWTKDCNSKMPSTYKDGKNSLKKWKTKKEYTSLGIISSIEVTNKAPHFHLVENGHRKFIHGVDTGGFVEGKHYAEKTRAEYESKYPEKMQEAANRLLADRGF